MNVCIYHGVDLDGWCSGAIWKEVHANESIDMIGLNYGQEIPWDRLHGNKVTLLDFCFQPISEFIKLLQIAHSVTWIDHHESAIKAWLQCERPPNACPLITSLDTTKAACELAWEFYHISAMPTGVFLLGDYDCWRHSNNATMPYQMGMWQFEMDPIHDDAMERWRKVFAGMDRFHEQVIQNGQIILSYQQKQNAKTAKAIWFPVEFAGHKWMAINQGGVNSQCWDSVWNDDFDGKLGFVRSHNHWTISLYSETIDCSVIAKANGGGGHVGASGFQCQELPFLKC